MKKILPALLALLIFESASLAISETLLFKLLELKRESYLSRRGELNLDIIPSYSQDTALVPWSITKSSVSSVGMNLRVGVSNRLEASLKIPYLVINRKVFVSSWESFRGSGIGDPSISTQFELLSERFNRPAVYLGLGATLPLTRSSFDNLSPREIAVGNGYALYDAGISFLKSSDPAVIYGGIDYQLSQKRGNYDPADVLNYNTGIGFALNQSVSVSIGISGAVVGEERQVVGGIETPVTSSYNHTALSLGVTLVFWKDLIFNPNVMIGLTEDETDFAFSFGVTKRIKEAQ